MAVHTLQVLCLSRKQFSAMLGNLSQLRSVWRLEALRKVCSRAACACMVPHYPAALPL